MNMKHLSVVLVVTALATVGLIGAVSVYAQSVDEETVSDDFQPNKNQHLVEDGDTLWDICEAVLGRPELWPRVWSMNPEITNPHWIYPGDIIRFEVPTEDLPSMDIMAEALTGVQKSGEDEEDTETVGEQEEEDDRVQKQRVGEATHNRLPSWQMIQILLGIIGMFGLGLCDSSHNGHQILVRCEKILHLDQTW